MRMLAFGLAVQISGPISASQQRQGHPSPLCAAWSLLLSFDAFACVLDSDCEPGTMCVDGTCIRGMLSGSGDNDVPVKRIPPKGKTCGYDGDCDPGSRCIKGSGPEGVCIGH